MPKCVCFLRMYTAGEYLNLLVPANKAPFALWNYRRIPALVFSYRVLIGWQKKIPVMKSKV